jgi:antitoxin PrlF
MVYHAKAATVGNSKALRLDAALFRAHPEFGTGEFAVSVIAPGQMLVQAMTESANDETDPVFDAFLGFVEHQMELRPDLISAVTQTDRREAAEILRGVRSDPNEDLGDDFVIPGSQPKARPRRTSRQTPKK